MGKTVNLKYMDIYDHFLGLIRSGVLKSGDKLPTEEQVAARFEVSRITVIRALNQLQADGYIRRAQGSGSYVSERTAGRGPLKVVSFIKPFMGQGREIQLLQGMEMRLKEAGYLLSVSNSNQSADVERELILSMKDDVRGIILYPVSSMDNAALYENLMKEQYPVVYVDRYPMNVPCSYAACDNFDGGYRIGRYFLENGHKKIALIYHDILSITSERDRFNGFMKAMAEAAFPRDDIKILSITRMEGSETLDRILGELYGGGAEGAHPTALFTFNDMLALAFMEHIRQNRQAFALPGGFTLAGFDNLRDTSGDVPFITIRQNYSAIGEKAAELLIARMGTNSLVNEQVVVPVELVTYGGNR